MDICTIKQEQDENNSLTDFNVNTKLDSLLTAFVVLREMLEPKYRILAVEGDLVNFSYDKIFEYSNFGRGRRFGKFLIWQNIRIFESRPWKAIW